MNRNVETWVMNEEDNTMGERHEYEGEYNSRNIKTQVSTNGFKFFWNLLNGPVICCTSNPENRNNVSKDIFYVMILETNCR